MEPTFNYPSFYLSPFPKRKTCPLQVYFTSMIQPFRILSGAAQGFIFHFIFFFWLIQIYNFIFPLPQRAKVSLGRECPGESCLYKTKYALQVLLNWQVNKS